VERINAPISAARLIFIATELVYLIIMVVPPVFVRQPTKFVLEILAILAVTAQLSLAQKIVVGGK
jgi:hypothetical protein